MAKKRPRAATTVLSDIGKVVLDYDDRSLIRDVQRLFRNRTEEEIWRVLRGAPAVPSDRDYLGACYARGEIDTREFLRQMARILDHWFVPSEAWLYRVFTSSFRPMPEVIELWRDLRRRGVTIIAVSNIEEICWRKVVEQHLNQVFDEHVLSFQEGLLKPSEEIMIRALDLAGCPAEEAVFIDDKPENLVPARRLGIRCHQYRDLLRLERFLERAGLPVDVTP